MIDLINQKKQNEQPLLCKHPKKDEFLLIKSKVLKQFPNAQTKIDNFKCFFVVDHRGFKIIPYEYFPENSKTVFDAWKITLQFLESDRLIKRNDDKFNPFKEQESLLEKLQKQK